MSIAFIKLPGLDSEKILAIVEPVLRAHRVEGVELVWRSDQHGWLLELTVERPEAKITGQGITVDLCSEISRDISAALDLAEVIGPHYRLEVGSPGVERPAPRVRRTCKSSSTRAAGCSAAPPARQRRLSRDADCQRSRCA